MMADKSERIIKTTTTDEDDRVAAGDWLEAEDEQAYLSLYYKSQQHLGSFADTWVYKFPTFGRAQVYAVYDRDNTRYGCHTDIMMPDGVTPGDPEWNKPCKKHFCVRERALWCDNDLVQPVPLYKGSWVCLQHRPINRQGMARPCPLHEVFQDEFLDDSKWYHTGADRYDTKQSFRERMKESRTVA